MVNQNDYVEDQTGLIVLTHGLKSDAKQETKVGEFCYTVINAELAIDDGMPLADVFQLTPEWAQMYGSLYDQSTERFKPEVMNEDRLYQEDLHRPSLFLINHLVILQEFRGNRLGLLTLRKILRLRQRLTMAVIKPSPLQCEGTTSAAQAADKARALGVADAELSEPGAIEKLARHFARTGFNPVAGTTYLVRDARHKLPDVEAMLGAQLPVTKPVPAVELYYSLVSRLTR